MNSQTRLLLISEARATLRGAKVDFVETSRLMRHFPTLTFPTKVSGKALAAGRAFY